MSSIDYHVDPLASINKRVVGGGVALPAVQLADGTKLQTGTVAGMLMNIKLYDRACGGEDTEGVTKEELEQMLVLPIPTLSKIGFFDIFPVDDWIAGNNPGRTFVGMKAKEMGY